jgi:hypothetical protein
MRHDRPRRTAPALAALAPLALSASGLSAGPARAEQMADYMVMQVCTDAAGAVLPGVAPIDPACTARRPLRPGETPPYRLRDWPPRDGGCHDGLTVKYNVPVLRHGVTRIVSFTDRAAGGGCDTGAEPDAAAESARGLSVQWHDGGYGFIMASWSPVAMSSFESPLCRTAGGGAARFFRGWVLAPATLPPPRQPGWGVFPAYLATGPAAGPADPCPARYNAALTLWVVDEMAFGAARLTAVVTHHFARTDPTGSAPGPAEQVERTYWTREFGLTRWEKWAREDWIHPRSHRPASELAAALFARGRCNQPYALPAAVTPRLQAENLTGDGLWRQVLTEPATRQRHGWVMTLCEDYTNIARTPPAGAALADAARIDDAYWRDETGAETRRAPAGRPQ